MPRALDHTATPARSTFRRRLLLTLGPALAVALIVLGLLAVLFAYGWMTYSAQTVLDAEINEVATQIVTPQGTLAPEAYHWNEPHHLFDEPHIDPYFLQVFDAEGHLVRLSENIRAFAPGTYPSRLLAYQTPHDWLIQRLRTFTVGEQLFYYRTRPLRNQAGTLLGYIQAARYEPGIAALLGRITLYLVLGLAPVLVGLLGLIWWGARRVVQPLEHITREARTISPARLGHRITIPSQADQETAHLAATLINLTCWSKPSMTCSASRRTPRTNCKRRWPYCGAMWRWPSAVTDHLALTAKRWLYFTQKLRGSSVWFAACCTSPASTVPSTRCLMNRLIWLLWFATRRLTSSKRQRPEGLPSPFTSPLTPGYMPSPTRYVRSLPT